MLTESLYILFGLIVLLVSGDLLVRGAVGAARALNVPALLVSLTIIAFGTSAPELVVAVDAVLKGKDGIALGNIVGSNIANVLLVIGLPAIIYPMSTHVPGLRRHALFMLIATAALLFIAYTTGTIDTAWGYGLFAGIIGYITYTGIRAIKSGGEDPLVDDVEEYDGNGVSIRTILFIVFGLFGLPLGAHLLVENGAELAANLGVRDEFIGLTIIAFGTSLPELATVAAAAIHKKSDVAIGNIIGSNIFNILAVGGAAGIAGGATFDKSSLSLDLPVMTLAAITISAFVFTQRDINRVTGAIMAIAYFAFIIILSRSL
ncbi:MAG: calcium/sodium antiporter [Pseudomonadota bacterium]